jgi:cytidine deaminase
MDWEALFRVATDTRQKAHAPYSNFKVGAALLTEDGEIIPGCNVENASYGLSICAERNAIARMVAEGKSKVVAVAVVADTDTPTPPCGACRQVLAEFASPQTPVRLRNLKGKEVPYVLEDLLPHAFTRSFL